MIGIDVGDGGDQTVKTLFVMDGQEVTEQQLALLDEWAKQGHIVYLGSSPPSDQFFQSADEPIIVSSSEGSP